MRAKIIVGNWKMNGSYILIDNIFKSFDFTSDFKNLNVVICPPDVLLCRTKNIFEGSGIHIGAQNVHSEEEGAFTGETSPLLLRECGVSWCIVGHSERREYFSETNELISEKIEILIKYGIRPILCVGETLEQRESSKYEEVIVEQLRAGLSKIKSNILDRCAIAYEPVWAIGTGETPESNEVNIIHKMIRKELAFLSNNDQAEKIQIIYGGSVNSENASNFLSMEEIDGALVGGASLIPESFQKIIRSL